MKKIFFISILFMLGTNLAFSQRGRSSQVKWLSFELKGGYGGSMLINKDIIADPNAELAIFSPAYEFGGKFGLTYGDYIGMGIEVLSSSFKQDYNIKTENIEAYTKTQQFKSLDIAFTFRFTSIYGFYVEVGPQFSTLKDVKVSNSIKQIFLDENDKDYQSHFSEKFTSIIFGLGFAAYRGDRLTVNMGLRAAYGLSPFVADDNFYAIRDGYYTPDLSLNTNAKTSPFSLKLTVGVNYIFGFWGDATCGRGRLVFFK